MRVESPSEPGATLHDLLGACLLDALAEAGFYQADLARLTGLSTKHINQMVHGKAGTPAAFDYAAFCIGRRWRVSLEPPWEEPHEQPDET